MQLYGHYNQKMAITGFILTAECERLVPSYSVYQVSDLAVYKVQI